MRALGIAALLGLAACAACAACASSTASATDEASAIQGGNVDATHAYAVGLASKLGTVCSGTLIAPNLVLTARHCVVSPDAKETVTCADTFGPNADVADLFVTTGAVFNGKAKLYAVAEITTPAADGFCGNDIALVRLAQNVPASEAEPAIPVVQFSVSDARLSGQIAAVGYGVTAPNATDVGTRRVRESIDILCLPGDDRYDCTKTSYASLLADDGSELLTQGYVCAGDSGGGAFDEASFTSGAAPYVLGALSRGPSTDTECLAAVYSRTDAHADLIVGAAKKAAQLGGYTAPGWATGAPLAEESTSSTTCNGDICTAIETTEPASEAPKAASCAAAPGTRSSGFAFFAAVAAVAAIRRRRWIV